MYGVHVWVWNGRSNELGHAQCRRVRESVACSGVGVSWVFRFRARFLLYVRAPESAFGFEPGKQSDFKITNFRKSHACHDYES
jgi:hypothetical protein